MSPTALYKHQQPSILESANSRLMAQNGHTKKGYERLVHSPFVNLYLPASKNAHQR